ncbi:hypothetical protein FIBSPDRAFT_1053150 [Athelia psychrophila]|uniref:Carbohydrate-binding module family 48 protein n=1 Tax=Athelia psychrophila TaxID=1759441 RepID=A0A167XF48_9AGAM|nr:hypothetical protein FIBSPDRAFT_1053150 [Fibularhizoctonia sp. CBS 109695]
MSSPSSPIENDTVQVTLTWPAVNVRDVIVTGDFDDWAMLTHMTKPAQHSRTASRTPSRAGTPPRTPTTPSLNHGYFPPSFLGIGANGNDTNGRGANSRDEERYPYHIITLPVTSALALTGFEYKFFVDGVWQTSACAPTRVDPSGKFVNNVWAPAKPKVATPEAIEEEIEDAKAAEVGELYQIVEVAGTEKFKKLNGHVEEKTLPSWTLPAKKA